MFSTRATATSIRFCFSMSATPDQVKRVLKRATRSSNECIRLGGSVTGEHGIGVEKLDFMPKLFTPEDLADDDSPAHRVQPEQPVQPEQDAADCRSLRETNSIPQTKPGRRAAV